MIIVARYIHKKADALIWGNELSFTHGMAFAFSKFFSTITMSGLLHSICGQFQQSNLHPSDSSTGFGSWSYQFWEQSKPNFWEKLQWTHLPTWSCLQPLYSFWANLSHSITMCLTESSCSRHILHNGGISSPSILFYYPVGSQRLILGSHYEAFCFFLQNAFS